MAGVPSNKKRVGEKMVVWFNNPKARAYLLEHGHVYTLRPKKRVCWIRDALMWKERRKRAMVEVCFIREINSDFELVNYVSQSGFQTVPEWRKAAGNSKYLYYVEIKGIKTPFGWSPETVKRVRGW